MLRLEGLGLLVRVSLVLLVELFTQGIKGLAVLRLKGLNLSSRV